MKRYVLCTTRAEITTHIRVVSENHPIRGDHCGWVQPPTMCNRTAVRDLFFRTRKFKPERATCGQCIAAHHKDNLPS